MEKRLFIAVFLSLAVVFVFQTFFGPKQNVVHKVEAIDNKDVVIKEAIINEGSLKISEKNAEKTVDFKEDFFTLKNKIYSIKFTNKGGNVENVYLNILKHEMPTRNFAAISGLDNEKFSVETIGNNQIKFSYKNPEYIVTKEFTLNENYTVIANISIKNIARIPKTFKEKVTNIIIDTSRLDKTNVQSDWSLYEYSIKSDKKFIRKDNARNFNDKWNKEESVKVDWSAFRDKYFVTIVEAQQNETNYFIKTVSDKELMIGTVMEPSIIDPDQNINLNYKFYIGPQKLDLLEKAGSSYHKVMVFSNWGWLDAISKGIHWLLGAIYKIIPVWGLCIIVISLIVYGAMYPLTAKSLISMKKLQVLQPKMKELQEKYKNNPERLNKEIVELYRVHQVNPLGGCLPMLLQMPIFVGLYQVLWRSIYFRGESFLWIKDLSLPDHTLKLPWNMPFLGEYLNILPILMIGIMFVQQQMNLKTMVAATEEQAQQQKLMAMFFPVLIGFIFYNMASGLNLYFVIFYILSAASQWHLSNSTKASV